MIFSKKNIFSRLPAFNKKIALILLSAFVISAFSITTGFDFVNADDNGLIYENPIITNNSIPFSRCFTKFAFSAYYKPLVFLTWKAEWKWLGSDPWHFHLINWLLHWANTLLLFFIGLRLFRSLFDEKQKILLSSFFLALLFSVNPLRVESVAWATERKDVLFGFFFLLGWWSYFRYLETKKYYFLLAGALYYLLSGLSKSMGLPFLGVIVLTDLLYKRKLSLSLIKEKVPYLVALLALLILYGFANSLDISESHKIVANGETIYRNNTITRINYINELPFWIQAVVTTSVKFILWIAHCLVPVGLSLIYMNDPILGWFGKWIFAFPFLVGLIYLFAWIGRKKMPYLIWGLLFFFVTLTPVLIQQSAGQLIFLADRYTYIPCIGIFYLLIAGIQHFSVSNGLKYSALSLISIVYLVGTIKYVPCWKNSETLFLRTLEISPDNNIPYQNLGYYYHIQKKNITKGLEYYNKGLQKFPNNKELLVNRSKLFIEKGEHQLAIQDLNKAIAADPGYLTSYLNKGIAFRKLGQMDSALAAFSKASQIDSLRSSLLMNKIELFNEMKQYDKSLQQCRNYLRTYYENAYILDHTGHCFLKLGMQDSAMYYFDKAIALNPKDGRFFINRSLSNKAKGNTAAAKKDMEVACEKLGKKAADSMYIQLGEK